MVEARRFPAAVIFDLDGTLIDSVGDIADVLNHTLATRELEPLDEATVATMVGGGARLLIERALARIGVDRIEAEVAALHRTFEERYLTIGAGRSRIFPGGRELIGDLRQAGVRLGVCTNKPEAVAVAVVEALELTADFPVVVGERPGRPRKPHPAMVQATLAGLGVAAEQAVMVGDTAADIDGARAAGVAAVAVSFGYGTGDARGLGADVVIDSLSELLAVLSRLAHPSRRRPQ